MKNNSNSNPNQLKKYPFYNYSQPKYLLYFFNLNIHKYISNIIYNKDVNKPITNTKYQSNTQIWNNHNYE